ncbi:MAG: hypothetical protein ABSB76_21505 [Streptosporangiaceae bacterium]|jgi:hypothetical protein
MSFIDTDVCLVARTINDLVGTSTSKLNAYWLAVAGNRKEYADRLASHLEMPGTPVLIVREPFDNANSIMSDLAGILERNRAAVLDAFQHGHPDTRPISIVLLAHNELAVAEGSSPVVWPDWVPVVGNTEVPCRIVDITHRINVPLDEVVADTGKLNRALYRVEGALIRRLTVVTEHVPWAHRVFFDVITRHSDVGWADFLAKVKSAHASIPSNEKYRPSVRTGNSIVSRLWEVAQTRCAKDIDRTVAGLVEALDVTSLEALQGWQQCLSGVLARSPGASPDEPKRFARSTLFTISASCQYVTCAAHAQDYPQFPLNLITSVVDDLYVGLANIEACLNRMPRKNLRRVSS